ncbi:MAG: hypothetical protein AB1439_12110 [candidate division FCPU426 bacterium]
MLRKGSAMLVALALLVAGSAGMAEAKAKSKAKSKSTASKTEKVVKSNRRSSYTHHFSESNFNPLNSVTFDPVGLAFGLGNLEYQRLISPTAALAGRILFGGGFGAGASYRFFVLDNVSPQEGLWVGPGMDVYGFSYSNAGQTASGFFLTPRAEGGYRLLFQVSDQVAFVVSPSLALGFTIGSVSVGGSTFGGGVFFGLGIGLGVAF